MKALSLTPPWLYAILRCGKRVENRRRWRGCSYRGQIALHAAQGIGTLAEFDASIAEIALIAWPVPDGRFKLVRDGQAELVKGLYRPGKLLVRGAIVGLATIVGTISADTGAQQSLPLLHESQRKWWQGGFALLLDHVIELSAPVPCKGALGLWQVPSDVEQQIGRSLCTQREGSWRA